MEAPDKIWINPSIDLPKLNGIVDKDSVQYIRKDSFVKKACKFIKEHHHEFSFWNTEEYELGFSTQKFIDDFKNYIELE